MTTDGPPDLTSWVRGRARSAGRPVAAPALLAALIVLIWLAYVRPLTHFDLDVFLRAGAAVGGGRDPYPKPGSSAVYSGFAFVYPYLVAFAFVPLARLPRAGAEALFLGLSVLALLGGCWLAGARRWRAYALVLAASCTIIGLQMGTLNALLFVGLAALWRARDRPLAAGALAALLVYSKLFLAPVPLWLLLTRRWRAAAAAGGLLVVLSGTGQWASPIGLGTYSAMLGTLARAEAPEGLSLTGLLMNVGLGLGAATWAARAAAVVLLAGWRLARSTPAEGDGLVFAAAVAAALLASPIVWSHYLLLLAVPLIVLEGGGRTGGLAVGATVSWLLVTPHLSTPADIAVSAAVLIPLVAPPLRDAARCVALTRRTVTRAAALGGLTLAGLELCWSLAHAHHGGDAVTGAYLATVAVIATVAWGARQTSGAAGRTLRGPHRCSSRPVGQVTWEP